MDCSLPGTLPGGASGKESAWQCRKHKERQDWSLDQDGHLEKEIATHSSILAWRIPWTEEPGKLQPIGLQTVGHDWSDLACIAHGTWAESLGALLVDKSSSQLKFTH